MVQISSTPSNGLSCDLAVTGHGSSVHSGLCVLVTRENERGRVTLAGKYTDDRSARCCAEQVRQDRQPCPQQQRCGCCCCGRG